MPPPRLAPRFHRISRLIRRYSDQDLAVLGIPSGQKDVLWEVLQTPGIIQTTLIQRLDIHKSVISRAIAGLERAGFVMRRVTGRGKTPRALYPTHLAVVLGDYTRRSLDHLEEVMMRGCPAEDRRHLNLSLQGVTSNLERQLERDTDPFLEDVIRNMKSTRSTPGVDSARNCVTFRPSTPTKEPTVRVILVVERKHLFPGLSPQGFLGTDAVDLEAISDRLFFAERDYMENNSHYKQIIPYLVLQRGTGADRRVLCYQRRAKHTEARLGGLWSVGFGGHIEPLDRDGDQVAANGVVLATALREMEEETGLNPGAEALTLAGHINSDSEDVSAVHFGVVFNVELDLLTGTDDEIMQLVSSQAEPHQARWIPATELVSMTGKDQAPDGGNFEDWSRIAVTGVFA